MFTLLKSEAKPPTLEAGGVKIRPVTTTLCASAALILAGRETKLASAGELKTLRELQTRCDALRKQLETVGHDAPKREHRRIEKEYHANPTAENFEAFQRSQHLDESAAHTRNAEARAAVKNLLQKTCDESFALTARIRDRAAQI